MPAKVVVAYQNVALSTANGFYEAEAYNLGGFSTTDLTLTSERTIEFNFAHAGNCQGFIISLVESVYNIDKSVIVDLQEKVTGTWTTRVSSTLTAAQITNSVANKLSNNWTVPFIFSSPYAVTTTAGIWRLRVTQGSGSYGNWSVRTSNGTALFFVTWCDNAVSFASGDTVIAATGIVTIDQTATFGPTALGTGETARAVCAIACRSTTPTPANVAMFVWENPPASSYTLTINGCFVLSSHAGFRAGTLASPIPIAQAGTILFEQTLTLGTVLSGFCSFERNSTSSGNIRETATTRKSSVFLYGEPPAVPRTLLASGVAVGASSLVSTDSTGWVNGDTFVCGKTTQKSLIDSTAYTVSSTSGTTVNFSPVLAGNARVADGVVIKTSGYGLVLNVTGGTTSLHPFFMQNCPSNIQIYGTSIGNHLTFSQYSNIAMEDTANESQWLIESSLIINTTTPINFGEIISPGYKGLLIKDSNFFNRRIAGSIYNNAYTDTVQGPNGAFLIENCYFLNSGVANGSQIPSTDYSITDSIFQHDSSSFFYFASINTTITGNKFWGNGYPYGSIWMVTVLGGVFDDNEFDCCTSALGFTACSDVKNLVAGNKFGLVTANTADLNCIPNGYFNQTLKNAEFNTNPVISDSIFNLASSGSWLRLVNVNGTLDDCRSWTRRGKFNSSSGKIIGYTIRTDETLENTYNFSTQETNNATFYAAVNCEIGSADYYGSVYDPPALSVYFDAGTTSTPVEAADNVDPQTLSVIVEPTTDYNPIQVILSQKTDAATANSGVTWDTLLTNLRLYGYDFQDFTTTIIQTLDAVQANFVTPVVDTFITESDAATVGAYTGITINHGTQSVVIDEAHSLTDLYDYAKWNLCQDDNMGVADWFTTIDGIEFTSTYDITIDGVLLTATDLILDLGVKDFSLTNGGTVVAKRVTDTDGSLVPISLNGLVNGSVYEVYVTATGVSVTSGTISGTSLNYYYLHTVDVAVTCRVRLAGYLEYEGTGTITLDGLTFNVSQPVDLNYNAAYDTDIPTEWTLDLDLLTLEHTSGTGIFTVRDLYSWTMDYMADASLMQDDLPLSAQTQTNFTLDSTFAMTDGSHEYLNGGAIAEDGGDILWANVYTVGSIAAGNLYIYQNAIEYAKFWGDGNIDVLLKVMDGGALIDSGEVTIFCREYGYLFDHYKVNLAGGGRTAVSVSTFADANNTTAALTIAGWADIVVTTGGGPYLHDIGDGDGDCPYTTEVDAGGHAIQDVYEYLKYLTEEGQAESYTTANASYAEVKQAPYGTFAGGIFFGARGIWIENVAVADALNYVLIDNDNDTHQAPAPPVQLSGTSIVDGSRIQVYDVDDATELANEVISGTTYSYEYDFAAIGGHTLRIRLTWASTDTYKEEWTTSVLAGETGCSFIANQIDWAGPNAWSIDGSAVTEFAADYPNVQIDADDADGETTKTRLGAWWCYNLTTEDGIANFFGGIEIPAANVIKVITLVVDLQIQNVSATSLVFTDSDVRLYRDDGDPVVASGTGSIEMDYSGVPDVVYISTGSGLSEEEHDQLMGLKSAYVVKRTA